MEAKVSSLEDSICFNGAVYTVQQFSEKFLSEEMRPLAIDTVNLLLSRGKITIYNNLTKEEKIIQKAMAENMIINEANKIEEDEETLKDNVAQKKRENHQTYQKIEVPFASVTLAQNCQKYCNDTLRIKNSYIVIKPTEAILTVENITDSELSKINRYYQLNNVTQTFLSGANKTQDVLTRGIDYSVKNIVSPLTSIGFKAGASIASTATTAVVKTGASAVDAVNKGVEKTINDIATDPDVIKASRDLLQTKAKISAFFNKKMGGVSNGIKITN